MEVISSDNGLLSNLEVGQLISDLRASRGESKKISSAMRGREIVERKILSYMQETTPYTPEMVANCLTALQAPTGPCSKLEDEERLQIVNLVPRTEIDFYLCLANRDSSVEEADMHHILGIVAEHFPRPQEEEA